ncbi:syntaxin-7-like [Drosophila miranda]|uniref:syntaxin-7-like n=1 Tax=Drosophila miranda TaxID=7229 RepID=UPI00143F323E|nr:syntaxin-7-like [Drosophila miranda]
MVSQLNTLQDSPELKKQLHQLMTYTNQLIKDTNNQINEVNKCKERHLKIQRDWLVDEFTAALTSFQAVQRKTAECLAAGERRNLQHCPSARLLAHCHWQLQQQRQPG